MSVQIGDAFQRVSDELLLELVQTDTPSSDLYGAALAESLERGLDRPPGGREVLLLETRP